MTSMHIRKNTRRAFGCWPSRIGALSLLALTASWGLEAYGGVPGPHAMVQSVAAVE